MIKNYTKFNEGIKHLLVGPTEEEIWTDLMNGKLKDLIKLIPESPKDFFNQIKEGCIEINKDKYGTYFGKNGKILFQEDLKYGFEELYLSNKYIWSIFRKIYGLNDREIKLLIKNLLIDDIKWNGLDIGKSIIE